MSTPLIELESAPTTPRPWVWLAIATPLLLWAFFPTLNFLYGKWVSDPQYSHGFLVPLFSLYLLGRLSRVELPAGSPQVAKHVLGLKFIALYLVSRLHLAKGVIGRPMPVIASIGLMIVMGMRWLAGGMMFHQLDALALLVALFCIALAIGGFRLMRAVWPAIIFLLFMMPLPYELERNVGGPLKLFATEASTFLLQTIGYPAISEGHVILIDEVRLGVVDACSGLKMLVTFAAFAVGAVLLTDRSRFEKLLILAGIVPIAVASNVLRITATGIAYTMFDDHKFCEQLHDYFGYVMMPVGLGLLAGELWMLTRLVIPPMNSDEFDLASGGR